MNRLLNIPGQQPIGLKVLAPDIDAAFDRLHTEYYSGQAGTLAEWFEEPSFAFLDTKRGNWAAHDEYFSNFTVIWKDLLNTGRHQAAEVLWHNVTQLATKWETARGERLHKGTPYYFWAATVLLYGDIDRGYLLSHQAFQEDVATSGQPIPDTPGYALISLNHNHETQAFRQWVQAQAIFLELFIADYNATHHRHATIDDVTTRFIHNAPSPETVFLFTYTVARLMNIAKLPNTATNNPFAGQLHINILFDLTLVIDAAIKHKNAGQWKFIRHAEHLSITAGHQLRMQPDLRDINAQFEQDFNATVTRAIDGTLATGGVALDRLQCDIALAYGIRNFGAHSTGTVPVIWQRFADVHRSLQRVLLTTIEYLY